MFRQVMFIPPKKKKTKLQAELESFLASGFKYAEYDMSEYKNACSCLSSLLRAIKTHQMTESIEVRMAEGKVYLINLLK